MKTSNVGKFVALHAAAAFALSLAMPGTANAGPKGTHFKASGPDFTSGDNGDEIRTPLDFEKDAAINPVGPASLSLFSRCRSLPGNMIGTYAPIASPESNAIVGDTQFFFADGTHCYNPQNESNIVVNPVNAQNLVTSANEYRLDGHAVYYSTNGGASWINTVLPGWTASTGGRGQFSHLSSFGDPVLAFSPDGSRLYYAGLVGNGGKGGNQGLSGIAVAVSTDGGANWGEPKMVSYAASNNIFNDKEWLAVAPNGTVYITWTRFFSDARHGYRESPIVISKSVDGGNSWSDFVKVSDAAHPYDQGSNPAVGPDGTLYVAYEGATPSSGYNQDALIVARSTDGGATFTNTEVARVYDDLDCYPLQIGAQGRQTLSFEQFRNSNFPTIALDSTIGATGKIVIVWADNRNHPSCGNGGSAFNPALGPTQNQVFMVTSSNGVNWSAPQGITTSDNYDKAYPSVAADKGRIVVGYYTRAYSPIPTPGDLSCARQVFNSTTGSAVPYPGANSLKPVCLDYAARSSNDAFASEVRLTSQSSNPYVLFSGSFIGDYTGMAMDSNGKGIAVWADFRGNPTATTPNQDMVVRTGL